MELVALTDGYRESTESARRIMISWSPGAADAAGWVLWQSSQVRVDGLSRLNADETVDGDRYLALLDAIDALLADPPLTPAAGEAAGQADQGRRGPAR